MRMKKKLVLSLSLISVVVLEDHLRSNLWLWLWSGAAMHTLSLALVQPQPQQEKQNEEKRALHSPRLPSRRVELIRLVWAERWQYRGYGNAMIGCVRGLAGLDHE